MRLTIVIFSCMVIGTLADIQRFKSSDAVETIEIGDVVATVTHGDRENVVERRDKNGNLLLRSEIFLDMDLEIDKPTDRNVCLLSKSSSNSTCFNEVPASEVLTKDIVESCQGREIWFLKPADCEKNSLDIFEGELLRQQRAQISKCCRYTKCWDKIVTYCCKTVWGICTKRCYKETVRSCSKQCVEGALNQY